jgi:hypothetical protein
MVSFTCAACWLVLWPTLETEAFQAYTGQLAFLCRPTQSLPALHLVAPVHFLWDAASKGSAPQTPDLLSLCPPMLLICNPTSRRQPFWPQCLGLLFSCTLAHPSHVPTPLNRVLLCPKLSLPMLRLPLPKTLQGCGGVFFTSLPSGSIPCEFETIGLDCSKAPPPLVASHSLLLRLLSTPFFFCKRVFFLALEEKCLCLQWCHGFRKCTSTR